MLRRTTGKVVQIAFVFDMSPEACDRAAVRLADAIMAVPGLRWKIWLIDRAAREAVGVYFFEDKASARAYLEGPIVTGLAANPALQNLTVRLYDIQDEATAITRGPVQARI